MSLTSLAAIVVYAGVIGLCLMAAHCARLAGALPGALAGDRRTAEDRRHWLLGAAIFAGLALFRLVDGEDRVRAIARGAITAAGDYAERTAVQVPLAIGALIAVIVMFWLFARSWQATRRGSRARPVLLSRYALFALVPLYGLRLVSLHQTDWLLYSGPIRINWLLEGAICAVVGGAAGLHAHLSRQRISFAARPPDRR